MFYFISLLVSAPLSVYSLRLKGEDSFSTSFGDFSNYTLPPSLMQLVQSLDDSSIEPVADVMGSLSTSDAPPSPRVDPGDTKRGPGVDIEPPMQLEDLRPLCSVFSTALNQLTREIHQKNNEIATQRIDLIRYRRQVRRFLNRTPTQTSPVHPHSDLTQTSPTPPTQTTQDHETAVFF